MSRHTDDAVLTEALRHLDPAPDDLTAAERERADATFARIVATPVDGPVAVEPGRPHRRRRRLLTAAGLTGAAGVAVPALLLGGGTAYGSWTPEPEPLTGAAATEAAATCRSALGVPDGDEQVTVAERRGEWTYVLLAGPDAQATCLMPNDLVGRTRGDSDDFFGSYGAEPPAAPTVAPDGLDEGTSMVGSTEEGWFSWAEGHVGSEVTGVTVHVSSGLEIEASVVGDRFAVWWPSVEPSSDNPDESWTYTVHLADGSTRETDG